MPTFENFTYSPPPSPTHGKVFRLVFMGSAEVGKSSIISRFLNREFKPDYQATVEEMHRGEYEVAGIPLTLDILDTSGTFPFPAMRRLSISTGDAFILVYSVQDESSFDEVKALRQQIIDEKGEDTFVPIVIVGNKADVTKEERAVRKEIAESTASIEWGHGYVETSAKSNFNIDLIFSKLFIQAHSCTSICPKTNYGLEKTSNLCDVFKIQNSIKKSTSRRSSRPDGCSIS